MTSFIGAEWFWFFPVDIPTMLQNYSTYMTHFEDTLHLPLRQRATYPSASVSSFRNSLDGEEFNPHVPDA